MPATWVPETYSLRLDGKKTLRLMQAEDRRGAYFVLDWPCRISFDEFYEAVRSVLTAIHETAHATHALLWWSGTAELRLSGAHEIQRETVHYPLPVTPRILAHIPEPAFAKVRFARGIAVWSDFPVPGGEADPLFMGARVASPLSQSLPLLFHMLDLCFENGELGCIKDSVVQWLGGRFGDSAERAQGRPHS